MEYLISKLSDRFEWFNNLGWLTCWLTANWWRYLLEPPSGDTSRWEAFQCRRKGHPCGMIYYNANALEPDDRCQDCYDHIG